MILSIPQLKSQNEQKKVINNLLFTPGFKPQTYKTASQHAACSAPCVSAITFMNLVLFDT
jgi:hypothetical protein